jgi:hypothetical protein
MGERGVFRLVLTALICSSFLLGLAPSAGAYIYYGTFGTIGRAENDGSSPEPQFIKELPGFVCGLAVDAGHIYWGDHNAESIGRARIDGTQVEPEFIKNAGAACGVAVSSTRVYWTSENQRVGVASLDGTGAKTETIGSSPCGIAVDSTNAYFMARSGSTVTIYKSALERPGEVAGTIEASPTGYCGFAVGPEDRLYWANGGAAFPSSSGLWGVSTSAPYASVFLAPTDPDARSVAVHGGYAYWSTYNGHVVNRVRTDGTAAPENGVVTGLGNETVGLAVDDRSHAELLPGPQPLPTPGPAPAGPVPSAPAPAAVPTVLTKKIAGGKVQFNLSTAASVRLVFEARRRGHLVHGHCKPGKAKKGSCAYFKVVATRTVAGNAGLNTLKLPKLAKGSYKVTIAPAGGTPVSLRVTVS